MLLSELNGENFHFKINLFYMILSYNIKKQFLFKYIVSYWYLSAIYSYGMFFNKMA